jgi:hypothetical protein
MDPQFLINQDSPKVLGISGGAKLSELANSFWTFGISALFVALFFAFVWASISKIHASSTGDVRGNANSKELLTKVIYSLIAVALISIFIFFVMKDFTFLDLKSATGTGRGGETLTTPNPSAGTGRPGTMTPTCINPELYKDMVKAGDGLCGSTFCKGLCNFRADIKQLAVSEARSAGVDPGIILALICRESSGDPTKIGKLANNGKEDCGLMQIHAGDSGKTKCSEVPNVMDPTNNIQLGIATYKQKLASVSRFSYEGTAKQTLAFAAYNCCANDDNPNDKSANCNLSTGWSMDLPKWACPINPGTGSFNMCAVKNYACDVTACAAEYTKKL